MSKRINALTQLTLAGEMFVQPVETEFDRMDIFLEEQERNVKQICEYIMNQQPRLTEYSAFTGFFNFNGSVIGDIMNRFGHQATMELDRKFYKKPIDNLSTYDAQHGTADYTDVLSIGMTGLIEKIEQSMSNHREEEKLRFLNSLKKIAQTIICWMKKCADMTREFASNVTDRDYKDNLFKLSQALTNISEGAPKNFYEAVLTIYVCFSFNPDSIGTLDRYLSRFYETDLKNGTLTRREAAEYLKELLLMVQAATPVHSPNFSRGGQSHFCVGGRDQNGADCFNDLSQLILESLTELPTYIPQVTLRWTDDLPKSTFRHVLQLERDDKNKRIAFTNDDRRIESFTKNCGFSYEDAVNYTLVGCNEPAMLGGMCASSSHANLARSLEMFIHSDDFRNAGSFEEAYENYKKYLYRDLDQIYYYDELFNQKRSEDVNYVSCLFSNGCIETGKSATQGGVKCAVSSVMYLGNVTVIDSLSIIKQFVFDEKVLTPGELETVLSNNWIGYEELKTEIAKRGHFFGNDDATSNEVAKRLYEDLYHYIKGRKTAFGYPILIGDHTGYMMHFKWFGEQTGATPDGRCAGDPLSYGLFQTHGKARNGLTALMNAVTKIDGHGISSATVTNFSLDSSYYLDEEKFNKTADLLEMYFRLGGIQFQLNHLEKEDLIRARKTPEDYTDLRVRVTGYSDYFNKLDKAIQDTVIARYDT